PLTLHEATLELLFMGVTTVMLLTFPVAMGAAIVGGLVEFLQVGPLFSQEALMPKLDKLNPLAGLKNMVSKKQLVELLKSTLKMTIAGYVVFGVVRDALGLVMTSLRGDSSLSLAILGELVYRVTVRVGLLFLVFAIFDVWWQRRSYMKDLMMTKDEVKREYKESEGDPHHKAKRKEMHHEILESAMMEGVKKADVVVTNPDHVAVALKYDRDVDQAPRVIAKGIDHKAEAIKALAKDGEVTLLRNVPLAHALLRLDVGTEIPEELYDAVAEVLNFVEALRRGETVT
ncbi:MAG: EscU/YscU/HrcU family type III secretion system export apparatus switch protein, partial [Myxococcaceae bacterium]